jgi:hypothetical protein
MMLVVALAGCTCPKSPTTVAAPAAKERGAPVAVSAPSASAASSSTSPAQSMRALPLPGASGAVSLDYLACDRAAGRVWIPAGGTGSVDVLDTATLNLTRIEGFPTAEREMHGNKRLLGPSSVSLGAGVAYVGNRANSEVCAIDAVRLVRGNCLRLSSSPDGLQYVAPVQELWVTTPRDKSLTILDTSDASTLKPKTRIALDGEPEGYGVDASRGVFYTNLEDKDRTLAVDIRTHAVKAEWQPKCGEKGPRGLVVDLARQFLIVACTDRVVVLDTAHGGTLLSSLDTGEGVDNIDYLDTRGDVYVAAGRTARLTIAHVDDKGALTAKSATPTAEGARVVVVNRDGTAYVGDPTGGRVLVVSVPVNPEPRP